MASNLRAKSISGHVTDGAGNVIRNSQITIRSLTPTGDVVVDSVVTNDDGYFSSSPLPSGEYVIYDSGVMVSTTIHIADASAIPAYGTDIKDTGVATGDFDSLVESGDINSFTTYIQIEPSSTNTVRYGSTFPIYDVDLKSLTIGDYFNMADFLNMSSDSRITTTRFDIEYYSPITEASKQYRRIRWSGVPAIRYSGESRLVVPLDYYSIVPTLPKRVVGSSDASGQSQFEILSVTGTSDTIVVTSPGSSIARKGDIVKLEFPIDEIGTLSYWYGINIGVSGSIMTLKRWRSSRVADIMDMNVQDGQKYVKLYVYDGMFSGLSIVKDTANEYITVVENVHAQDAIEETYKYDEQL